MEDTKGDKAEAPAPAPTAKADEVKADEVQPAAAAPTQAAAATAPVPSVTVEDVVGDVPDPDEDDLDDLDDLLDDFSAAKIDSKALELPPRPAPAAAPAAAAAAPTLPLGDLGGDASLEDLLGDNDFAKQLQAGMADLIGEFEKSPDMQAQFESLFKELGVEPPTGGDGDVTAAAAAATGAAAAAHVASKSGAADEAPAAASAGPSASSSAAPAAGDASFNETIRRTMERMQASGDQATAAAAADSESTDDLMSEFMKQMQSGGLGGPGSEEELSKMLVGMMEELTNKEILYEPMKELNDKFPAWMAANQDKTGAEDLKRYNTQQVIVREIVVRFELPSYSDANPDDREYIVDRMQKMQAAGSPPPDLVGDMPSTQEALAAPDESCNPQ